MQVEGKCPVCSKMWTVYKIEEYTRCYCNFWTDSQKFIIQWKNYMPQLPLSCVQQINSSMHPQGVCSCPTSLYHCNSCLPTTTTTYLYTVKHCIFNFLEKIKQGTVRCRYKTIHVKYYEEINSILLTRQREQTLSWYEWKETYNDIHLQMYNNCYCHIKHHCT